MKFRNIIMALFLLCMSITHTYAQGASMDFAIILPEYLSIQTLSNPVLTANITDKTGNLYAPLATRFRVVSNSMETKTLYLKSESITANGIEDSMFSMGGRVYIAFTYVNDRPSSEALANCKMGTHPKYSSGVVAYPITSVFGAKSEYSGSINRYKVYVENGVTDISVNVGSNVLRTSFDKHDPRGFYQATLSLTESEL